MFSYCFYLLLTLGLRCMIFLAGAIVSLCIILYLTKPSMESFAIKDFLKRCCRDHNGKKTKGWINPFKRAAENSAIKELTTTFSNTGFTDYGLWYTVTERSSDPRMERFRLYSEITFFGALNRWYVLWSEPTTKKGKLIMAHKSKTKQNAHS